MYIFTFILLYYLYITLNNNICFSVITRCLSCYFLPNLVTVASNFGLGKAKSFGIGCHNGPDPVIYYYYYINLFNIYF